MSDKHLPNPTTEEMAREVYEAITGKCWHEWSGQIAEGDERDDCVCYCNKCSKRVDSYGDNDNPPLATSLDAWRPIWEAMTDEQKEKYAKQLRHNIIFDKREMLHPDCLLPWYFEATPMHHLTAAWNVIKGGK